MWRHKLIAPLTPAPEEKISVPKNSRSVGYRKWYMSTPRVKLIIATVIIKYLPNWDIYDLNSITVNNSEQAKRALSASRAWHPRKGSFPVWPYSGEAGEQGTYSVWYGTTSSWKNFLTLSRKMSCSVEKILLIPISVNFLAEGVSRRASAPEWEHLEETCIRKIKSTFTFDIQMNASE